jgi:hypothetical protein
MRIDRPDFVRRHATRRKRRAMTVEQRGADHHVSAATVHQVLVTRGLKVRDMDHGQSATNHSHEHCGFLFPEYESYVDQCGSQWSATSGKRGRRSEQRPRSGA